MHIALLCVDTDSLLCVTVSTTSDQHQHHHSVSQQAVAAEGEQSTEQSSNAQLAANSAMDTVLPVDVSTEQQMALQSSKQISAAQIAGIMTSLCASFGDTMQTALRDMKQSMMHNTLFHANRYYLAVNLKATEHCAQLEVFSQESEDYVGRLTEYIMGQLVQGWVDIESQFLSAHSNQQLSCVSAWISHKHSMLCEGVFRTMSNELKKAMTAAICSDVFEIVDDRNRKCKKGIVRPSCEDDVRPKAKEVCDVFCNHTDKICEYIGNLFTEELEKAWQLIQSFKYTTDQTTQERLMRGANKCCYEPIDLESLMENVSSVFMCCLCCVLCVLFVFFCSNYTHPKFDMCDEFHHFTMSQQCTLQPPQNHQPPVGRRRQVTEQRAGDGSQLPVSKYVSLIMELVNDPKCDGIALQAGTSTGKTTLLSEACADLGVTWMTIPTTSAVDSTYERKAKQDPWRSEEDMGMMRAYKAKGAITRPDMPNLTICSYGVYQNRMQRDRSLEEVLYVMHDEAHDGKEDVDIALGYTKLVLADQRRQANRSTPLTKIIIVSATLQSGEHSEFFGIPTYKLPTVDPPFTNQLIHKPPPPRADGQDVSMDEVITHAVQVAVDHINSKEPKQISKRRLADTMIVFFEGMHSMIEFKNQLERRIIHGDTLDGERHKWNVEFHFVHAEMSQTETDIFHKPHTDGMLRVVLGTNYIESSITVDLVSCVIDLGFCKREVYCPQLKACATKTIRIDWKSAKQRMGRGGRVCDSVCYFLVSQEEHAVMEASTVDTSEVGNLPLTAYLLKLMGPDRGIDFVHDFPKIHPPQIGFVDEAIAELIELGCYEKDGLNDRGLKLRSFNIDYRLGHMLLYMLEGGRMRSFLWTLMALCVEHLDVFKRVTSEPKFDKQDEQHSKMSDFLRNTLALLRFMYLDMTWTKKKEWCMARFMNPGKAENAVTHFKNIARKVVVTARHERDHDQSNKAKAETVFDLVNPGTLAEFHKHVKDYLEEREQVAHNNNKEKCHLREGGTNDYYCSTQKNGISYHNLRVSDVSGLYHISRRGYKPEIMFMSLDTKCAVDHTSLIFMKGCVDKNAECGPFDFYEEKQLIFNIKETVEMAIINGHQRDNKFSDLVV